MQTFLPYPCFVKSGLTLDFRRLNSQRAEAYQLLRTLAGKSAGWRNHPAARMWDGYRPALFVYACVMDEMWLLRGGKPKVAFPPRDLGSTAYRDLWAGIAGGEIPALAMFGNVCERYNEFAAQHPETDPRDCPDFTLCAAREHEVELPPWLGGDIHASHQRALLAKQPEYYSKLGWAPVDFPDLEPTETAWPVELLGRRRRQRPASDKP